MSDRADVPGGWFDLRRIDINTVVILLTFIVGGIMFVARTEAELTATRSEIHGQGERIDKLTDRVDSLFSQQAKR